MIEGVAPQANILAMLARIQPREADLARARVSLGGVRARLSSSFDVARVAPLGSHARRTAVRDVSDLDTLVVLRTNEAKWGGRIVSSETLLRRVRDDLAERYTQTAIRRDQQAAVVAFSGGQRSLDVVPAIWSRFDNGPTYRIPKGDGDWIETSPDAHNTWFSIANQRSAGKLRGLCQMLRWWKYARAEPIPISTFYIDILMADCGVANGVKSYAECLGDAFAVLRQRRCRGLQDPLGKSGVIPAAGSAAKLEAANAAVNSACERASYAVQLERAGDRRNANAQWNIVFNGRY